MKYVLESENEFERLEAQSKEDRYSPNEDFKKLKIPENAKILDAGSGSGIAARYLAEKMPKSTVVGMDASEKRVALAKKASGKFKNLSFQHGDLCKLDYKKNHFDFVFSRYVFEHLNAQAQKQALDQIYACMKPKAQIWLIDIDGLFLNIYPRTDLLEETLTKMERKGSVDLRMGRKLPHLLSQSGFECVDFEVQAIAIANNIKENEILLLEQKFDSAKDFVKSFLPKGATLSQFKKEYFESLRSPGCTLFYNKFIARGFKPSTLKIIQKNL